MKNIPWWAWAIGLGGVGYIIYQSLKAVPKAASAATNAVSSSIANLWLGLPWVGIGQGQEILGSVQLPNGGLVPLNTLSQGQIRQDPDGNVGVNISGMLYQLAPSNAQGNFPATLIGPAPAGA